MNKEAEAWILNYAGASREALREAMRFAYADAANIARAIDSNRGNEKEIAAAIEQRAK